MDALDRLPAGTVTFLMTDIEGSTRMWNNAARDAPSVLKRHDRIVATLVEANRGNMVESGREGDSVLAAFANASDGVACGVEIQRALLREAWPSGIEMRVRIAVHTGEADLHSGHYVGAALYRCARLMAIAHGGQVLISNATRELVADRLPDGVRLKDLGEHQLRDLSRPERVYQAEHIDLPSAFPALTTARSRVTNMPEQLTSFVGRESELAAVAEMLHRSRLVTIHGPGGIGKSRLAAEIARSLAGSWADGTWWIDLSPVSDSHQVVGAVAATLRLGGVGTGKEVVESWLGDKSVLLVLDCCEQVIEGCADFAGSCLQHCPHVSVLATSREAMGVVGEARWPLAALTEADAASLFEQRGRLADPNFKVTDSNRKEVDAICSRLDELPLAIELAASRLRTMSEREMSERLVDRLNLLSARGAAEPRHQTMAATLDWSHRLLTDAEAALFRRLGVFRGGFTQESVQAVCGDVLVPDIAGALDGLVDKSMAVAQRLGDGGIRYRLLDIQASYAEGKLIAAGEADAIRQRHYAYFLKAIEARSRSIARTTSPTATPGDEAWKRVEAGNLWAALEWARSHEPDMGLALAAEVATAVSGDLGLLRSMLGDLLRSSPAGGQVRMLATRAACFLAFRQGDPVEYLRLSESNRRMAEAAGDSEILISAFHGIGSAQLDLGRYEEAETAFIEGMRLAQSSGTARQIALLENDLGCLALCQGRYRDAREILEECVRAMREASDASADQLASTIETLASAELGCGEANRAEGLWKEGLRMDAAVGDHYGVVGQLGGLSRVATELGDDERAVRLAGAHDKVSVEFSNRDQPWWLEQLRLSQAVSRERLGEARSVELYAEGAAMSFANVVEYALAGGGVEAAPA